MAVLNGYREEEYGAQVGVYVSEKHVVGPQLFSGTSRTGYCGN